MTSSPGSHAERPQGDHERVRAVGDADAVRHADLLGEHALDLADARAEDEAAGVDDLGDRASDLLAHGGVLRMRVHQGHGHAPDRSNRPVREVVVLRGSRELLRSRGRLPRRRGGLLRPAAAALPLASPPRPASGESSAISVTERPQASPLANSSSGSTSPSQPRKCRSRFLCVDPKTALRGRRLGVVAGPCSAAASRSSRAGPSAYPLPMTHSVARKVPKPAVIAAASTGGERSCALEQELLGGLCGVQRRARPGAVGGRLGVHLGQHGVHRRARRGADLAARLRAGRRVELGRIDLDGRAGELARGLGDGRRR